jgi:hypothetical protein
MSMKNREVYVKDPLQQELLNNGVAEVKDTGTPEELRTLCYELQTFVCEGQYAKGLQRILDAYLRNLKNPEQPAVWVSGFFGSGKSHFVKMLRALWVDYQFSAESTGLTANTTARELVQLTPDVVDLLTELSTQGKRQGGLHAAAGTLGAGAGDSVRLALLSIVFRSKSLPERYPLARFVMWLQSNGCLEAVQDFVRQQGKAWEKELDKIYVSPVIWQAVSTCVPGFDMKPTEVGPLLKTQFPDVKDVSNEEMVQAIEDALTVNGKFSCTLIALDEVQQYIGDDSSRTYRVQEVTEACSKHFAGRLLFVATGQTALAASTPQLQKLQDRFRISVELSDQDVDTVIRQIILQKKPDAISQISSVLTNNSGEISRHLVGTRIEHRMDDQIDLVPDYPLLPVRRRFWEKVLRAVDQAGTQGQLRNQLKVVYEATRETAEAELGTVVGADFIFDQLSSNLIQSGVLPREIYENIRKLQDGSADGKLKAKICALVFLIGRLPRDAGSDLGIRATHDALADLLIEDLSKGSGELRKRIPRLLQELLNDAQIMQLGAEYRIQTRESSAWDSEYRQCLASFINNAQRLADERATLLQKATRTKLEKTRLTQGQGKEARKLVLHFGLERPAPQDQTIPVWIRDGWSEEEKSFEADAQAAGTGSAMVFVFIPKRKADDFQKYLAEYKAADATLKIKGVPNTEEGLDARTAIETRRTSAEENLKTIIDEDILSHEVRVLQGGGQEIAGTSVAEMVQQAAEAALLRLFPEFDVADSPKWDTVITRARRGDGSALEVLSYQGDADEHPVCKKILQYIATGKRGSDIRKHFSDSPYGWSQDAVDACLYVLLVTEHLRAMSNGKAITWQQITDRRAIGQTDFRVEAITLTAVQKIAIRKLFQAAGVSCQPNDDLAPLMPQYINAIRQLAERSGGDAPSPECPDMSLVDQLAQQSGNAQLQDLYDSKTELEQCVQQWKDTAQAIAERKPQWQTLQNLLGHAKDLPGVQEIQTQANAILANRLLLMNPNPMIPLCNQLTQLLQQSWVEAQAEYQQEYEASLTELQATEDWQQLAPQQQKEILQENQLEPLSYGEVDTPDKVIKVLGSQPLNSWGSKKEALSLRIAQARVRAAKVLQPQATELKLPNSTIRTPEEAEQWLFQVRELILESLKQGPVIL